MSQTPPSIEILYAFAAGILREEPPEGAAARAVAALEELLREQKSFVIDVQFTGFTSRGKAVGSVEPRLLRTAGQLIMHRVSRIGFTADARAEDLAALVRIGSTAPAALGEAGMVGALREVGPRGIYLSTSTGDTYRPPALPAAAPPAAAQETPAPVAMEPDAPTSPPAGAPPAALVAPAEQHDVGGNDALGFDPYEVSFSDFEILEAFPSGAPRQEETARSAGGVEGPPTAESQQPASSDLFHFFRASGQGNEPAPGQIPELLRAAESVNHFDEAANAATRAAQRLTSTGDFPQAVAILEALVREAGRADRTRLFREAAEGALRRIVTDGTLTALVDRLQHAGNAERERILRVATFVGGDATTLLEGMLFKAADADLRHQLLTALSTVDGMPARLRARAMGDPAAARTRALLEAALGGAVSADAAQQWVGDAASHPDATVRMDAARHAATIGGRGGLRILVDLLNDANPAVKRAALDGMGGLGDPTAVPFLARALNDAADEDVQIAAIGALGHTGSGEAVAALLNVVNRWQLFSGKKLVRVKVAALAALARIPTPAAREVLTSVANGKDGDLAPEARRVLSLLDPS